MTDDELRKTLLMSLSDDDVGRVLAHFTARIPTLLQVLLEERRSPSKFTESYALLFDEIASQIADDEPGGPVPDISALLEFLKLYSVSR